MKYEDSLYLGYIIISFYPGKNGFYNIADETRRRSQLFLILYSFYSLILSFPSQFLSQSNVIENCHDRKREQISRRAGFIASRKFNFLRRSLHGKNVLAQTEILMNYSKKSVYQFYPYSFFQKQLAYTETIYLNVLNWFCRFHFIIFIIYFPPSAAIF